MNLRATINGKQYDILQGATFAEEFNETLDSGSIVISGVEKINDLLPYDDVYIYSFKDPNYEFKGYPFDTKNNPQPKFYKHLLVDQFTEEVLRLGDERGAGTYKYKIELMSETKKLETIQLPNISITQPITSTKTSTWIHILRFVNLYSPTYKVKTSDAITDKGVGKWITQKKYTVSSDLEAVFGNVYTPDFVLNAPSLRVLLSKLFLVKDMIPYVKDDVIYGMDISKRGKEFDINDKYLNIITGTRTSDNHCDNLRRNYSDALVQDRTCRSVECVGFRNSDNALMTISNMRLELGMPIYKIRKIYLCYYKDIKVNYTNATNEENRKKGVQDGVMLCKQDITKLVKLNTERNLLSQDWENLQVAKPPKSVDEMAQYKYCTVGYDIGSRFITGWGDIYTYPTFWNDNKYTSVQNIVSKMDYFCPYGIYNAQYVAKQFGEGCTVYATLDASFWAKLINDSFSGNSNDTVNTFFSTVESPFTNASLKLKGLFFIVDYEGFYNGAIIHSKKNHRDDITINDNTSESLTLVEQDAIFQNEKVNRFGNKALQINARYDSFYDSNDEELLQPLASVYNSSYENDVIIYHREYSIYNNCVQCIYYGIKNYILKNWFTSVYAKYRTWNLMSYNESVRRAENEKEYIYWAEDELYYEKKPLFGNYSSDNSNVLNDLISCFSSLNNSDIIGIQSFSTSKKIDTAYIVSDKILYDAPDTNGIPGDRKIDETEYFSSDLNAFVANNSMCFNLKLNDNFSQGVYISKAEPFIGGRYNDDDGTQITDTNWIERIWDFFTKPANSDYSGSKQDYYSVIDKAPLTGDTQSLGFYVGKKPSSYSVDLWESNEKKSELTAAVTNLYTDRIFTVPKLNNADSFKQQIGIRKNFYKDNKSFIDMTLQIENLTMSDNVILSPWVMKLSDLLGDYPKFDVTIEDKLHPLSGGVQYIVSEFLTRYLLESNAGVVSWKSPIITFKFSSVFIEKVKDLKTYEYEFKEDFNFLFNPEISDTKLPELRDNQIFLKNFNCEKIRFGTDLKTLELCGKLTMWYKSVDISHYTQTLTNIPFVFRLFKMGNQGSLINSIIPNADQSKPTIDDDGKEIKTYGKSLNDSIIYYSSLIDQTDENKDPKFNWATIYDPKTIGYFGVYPQIPGDIAGGYQTTDSNYIDDKTYVQGKIKFKDINSNDIILPPSSPAGDYLHDYVRIDLNQGDYGTQRLSWSGKDIATLHNITGSAEIKYANASYATYHKNMFLRYDTEKSLDPQALKDSYKYSEIENSKDFNFKSPVSNYFVSQLNNSGTPYIEIPSIYKVIYNTQNKITEMIWRDSKIPLSTTASVINENDIYFTKQDNKEELQLKFLIVAPDKNNPKLINVFWGNDYDAEGKSFSIQYTTSYSATKLKALSFWYLDDFQNGYTTAVDSMGYVSQFKYDPSNCYCHFVFGVNITDNFSRKIYLSMLKKKDLRVFDEHHQVIGESKNYLNSNGEIDETYATGQFFTKKNN